MITNAIRVANLLVDIPGIDLALLGGAVRSGEQTMHGHLKEWVVNQFRVDKLFYGSDAIFMQNGIMKGQIIEVSTEWAIVTDKDLPDVILEGMRATNIQALLT